MPVVHFDEFAYLREIRKDKRKKPAFVFFDYFADFVNGFGVRNTGPHAIHRIRRIHANAFFVPEKIHDFFKNPSLRSYRMDFITNHVKPALLN